jgi:hypothetical protein
MTEHECKDCARYVPYTGTRQPHTLLPIEGYCQVPERTGGLLGTVEQNETLNILFARGLFNCNKGKKWFLPKEQS